MSQAIQELFKEVRDCTYCDSTLPMGPRPIVRGGTGARICIIGQAPGIKVHKSGVPWADQSGKRLRKWLQVDEETFYNENLIAIIPMGFCYPGTMENGADYPPPEECAPLWHATIFDVLNKIEFTLLVGSYAQAYYLRDKRKKSLTETVRAWQEYLPKFCPIPHPSWRTRSWQKNNMWFDEEVLPDLRTRVQDLLR